MSCASFSMLDGPGGTGSSKLNKFLHCEVNQIIQHIIVQDQDGQNNNIIVYLRLQNLKQIQQGCIGNNLYVLVLYKTTIHVQ